MGRKHKRTQQSAKPKSASRPVQSKTIHLAVSVEQLIKNGNILEAIDELKKQLKAEPTDERRKLLGSCYFRVGNYREAANAWLTLKEPTARDLIGIGAAWLNENEWELAKSVLQSSLNLEEDSYALYLQALAIKGDRDYYFLRGEDYTTVTGLLQKACAIPDCPVEAFLLLDDLLNRHEPTPGRTALLEMALLYEPDHTELRLRYVRHLTYEINAYDKALIAAEPLLLLTPVSQYALACATRSAFKLGLFERALSYAEEFRPSTDRSYGPGLDQVKGDIYLAWGKTDEALACYERETQRDDFAAVTIGFFRIARVWLTLKDHKKALNAALEGTSRWLDCSNNTDGDCLLTYCRISVGEAKDWTDASLYFSSDITKEVCEALLSSGQEIAIDDKGKLAYLLYKVYEAIVSNDDEDEVNPEMKTLLLTVEQGVLHPHMGETLATLYVEKRNVIRAMQVHIDYCLWKFSALEKQRPQAVSDDDSWQLEAMGWTFSPYEAQLSCDQDILEALQEEEIKRCHIIAWEALQNHVAKTDIVTEIFVPLFNSFWSDVLIAGNMHREVVETARLLIQASADDKTLWWLFAYHLHELEQNDEAERAYQRYLELVPDSADAMHNLSLILEEKGVFQEALALSQKAATLSPDDELIVNNNSRLSRINEEPAQAQQKRQQQSQQGVALWSRLTNSQKWLLCLVELYPCAHWSTLLPKVKLDESQLRQLQEDWEWLLAQNIWLQSEPEQPVCVVPPVEPYVCDEGFCYWLATELVRVQIRKKKNLWLPAAVELGDQELASLSAPQRDLMQQAFMRQITQVALSGLEKVYLRFYRRIWKRLLLEWKMESELTDSSEVFLTRLPSIMTRQEMWECAYYATDLSDYTYQNRAEKWYKVYLEQKEDYAAYHNLSVMYLRRKQYQDALQTVEHALRVAPEATDTLKLKTQIQQAIQREEERTHQQELEQQRQKELREQRLKELESTITTHLSETDQYKQKILRAVKETSYFYNKKALAKELRMEDWSFTGHWKKLVAWGMIIEDGQRPTVHPLVATYLERGWPVASGSYMKTVIINPSVTSWTKPVFNSKQEYKLYQVLLEMFPGQLVFPNMALQSIFPYAKMKELLTKEEFNYYMVSSVDICLTRTTSYFPLVAFEVDGPWHEEEEQQRRDALKNRIFEQGGLGLIRLQIGYQPLSTQEMWESVRGKINQAMYTWQSDPIRKGWVEDLESELGVSRLRNEPSENGQAPIHVGEMKKNTDPES